jgi:hypothetical protein
LQPSRKTRFQNGKSIHGRLNPVVELSQLRSLEKASEQARSIEDIGRTVFIAWHRSWCLSAL